ncbi:diguanylate cyclase/phosphodiesterase [Tamaricihabitans halophyticus]|uniref:Diguanylate cyclase/phosphodiesterase n=1 Tax=Tamaricihabitans halophyticus TaxID=1262583 RepID=A0A4R2QTX7_9PSEU|nr:EAL domain-containing protein [Tamaricihabitans halophyticus]TCP53167.1 diguanylate cyclase/phosphodiesterase [Tamaricihabitans halophyticus]
MPDRSVRQARARDSASCAHSASLLGHGADADPVEWNPAEWAAPIVEPAPPDAEPTVSAAEHEARERRFQKFTAAVVLTAILTALAVSWWLPFEPSPHLWWVGLLLALGFLLAEQLAINVDVRSGLSWTISFTEIPLVIGLFVAPFEVTLLAHLVAGIGVLLLRKVSGRVLCNAGVLTLEVVTAYAAAAGLGLLLGAHGLAYVAVLVGAILAPVVSTALAWAAVWVFKRQMRLDTGMRLMARILVVGLVNAAVGLICYQAVVYVPWGWPVVLVALGGLGAMYTAYAGLLREQRDLEALSDVSLLVARFGQHAAGSRANEGFDGDAEQWRGTVERIKDQLAARRVVLRMRVDPQEPMRTLLVGDELPGGVFGDADEGGKNDPLTWLPGSQVRHFRAGGPGPEVQRALRARDAREALVVPLRSASQLLGVLEVHDRLSHWRGFGKADVQLIGTMASHLAMALDNRRLLATLRHDAYHDPLTGLLNRPGFRQASAEPVRVRPESVVLRIDLEVLSTVSEALGYAWGDRLVVVAGRRVREVLGPEVLLARLEGNSFAALLTDTSSEQAQRIGERLRQELSRPYAVDRLTVEANAVVGYVSATGEDGASIDVDALLQRADVAVRAARGGTDPVRGYVPSMGQIFLRRFQLVTQFRHALETGQVAVHYQPKVSLPQRNVLGVEALVRWQHPEFGALDPDEFVPAVEAAGLIDVLTDFVLDQALRRVRKWLDGGLRISASVNISVRSLVDEGFPDRVIEALRRVDVPVELLTFELTESGVMADPQRAMPILRRLHALGVELAVDDFGTGYSSLAYLRQLPVDEVKIDKSFVLGMGTDLGDLAVVRSIVELGHSLGLRVVAEGVEEDVARDQLSAMGCDVAQGYLISRPLSEDRLEAWLQARTTKARGLRDETVLTLVS